MPAHFVFVRFFPGFSEPFPFNKLFHTKEEQVEPTLKGLCEGWFRENPLFQEIRARRTREDQLKALGGKLPGWSRRPGQLGGSLPAHLQIPEQVRGGSPNNPLPLSEIIKAAGWGQGPFVLPFFIPPGFPFAELDSMESSEIISQVFQVRAEEIIRSKLGKNEGDGKLNWFAASCPKFFPGELPSLVEQMVAREKNQRLGTASGKSSTIEESSVRLFFPEMGSVLDFCSTLRKKPERKESAIPEEAKDPGTLLGDESANALNLNLADEVVGNLAAQQPQLPGQAGNIDWQELLFSPPLSASQIAEKLGQRVELVERALRYFRSQHDFGFVRDDDPGIRRPRFLYKMEDVIPYLKKWVAKRHKKAGRKSKPLDD